MTLDRTLKQHGGLVRSRNVLTRAERIKILTEEGKFDPDQDSPLHLPKVKIYHSKAGTKSKKAEKPEAEVEAEAAAEGAAAEGAAEGAAKKTESKESKE